jgi:two-component system, NarL family, nitrate/nitrite response regulator NarL
MRVLIIDDHKLFAEAIRSALRTTGLEVLPVATSGAEGLRAARSAKPDLVLLDLGLPDDHGIAIGQKILEADPDTKVIAVTALNDPRLLRETVKAGFNGYLTKDVRVWRLVESIHAVMEGQSVMAGSTASAPTESRRPIRVSADVLVEQLTKRERDVLGLLVQGATSEGIARRLSISPNTVRTHVQNVLSKLQVHSRLQAATFAVRHGLVGNGRERREA